MGALNSLVAIPYAPNLPDLLLNCTDRTWALTDFLIY
jgi:hypothetical protein